ncbi:MAG: FtsX-like permease family protein [Bacteroidota bacterium]
MLLNYLKMALKALGRNRMYTAITLFGISFTLMVLMIILALYDTEMGSNTPISRGDRIVNASRLEMFTEMSDTTWTIDSQLVAGQMTYDTLDKEINSGRYMSAGYMSYRVLTEHLSKVEPKESYTLFFNRMFTVFKDGQKFSLRGLYTDSEYWNIYDFTFLAGGPFNYAQVESAESVAILSQQTAEDYFGGIREAIGQNLPLSGRSYEIIGVIDRIRTSNDDVNAEVYMPVTTTVPDLLTDNSNQGPFQGAFLAASTSEVEAMKQSMIHIGKQIPIPPEMDFEQISIDAFNREESYADDLFYEDDVRDSVLYFRLLLFVGLGLFILIPVLNLININLTRMMERASEISVRKAYGARRDQILGQFLFENVIVTFIGGLIGLGLSLFVIQVINSSGAMPNTVLSFNGTVFFYSFLLCLALGILSGLLPAWRISKQQISEGLRQ